MLDSHGLLVDGRWIDAVFLRARPHESFSVGFRVEDRAFVDIELAAVWLAAIQPPVRCVNRYDAGTWFERSPWMAWRRRLVEAGVPVVDLEVCGRPAPDRQWLPYGRAELLPPPGKLSATALGSALVPQTGARSDCLIVAGAALGRPGEPTVDRVAQALARLRVGLARVLLIEDAVVAVDTAPLIDDEGVAQDVARRLLPWIGF